MISGQAKGKRQTICAAEADGGPADRSKSLLTIPRCCGFHAAGEKYLGLVPGDALIPTG
jgi:hypothetical protein